MNHTFQDFSAYHFREQHEAEQIISVIHRHWFNIAVNYAAIGVLVLLQITSIVLFEGWVSPEHRATVWPPFLLLQSVVLMFLWLYGFLIWIDYWLDVWIVTDERVINIEQKGLFSRSVSELHFYNVQDVTTSVRGVIPTLLNYGDVEVQTAGERTRFLFRQVPDPYAIKAMVIDRTRQIRGQGFVPRPS